MIQLRIESVSPARWSHELKCIGIPKRTCLLKEQPWTNESRKEVKMELFIMLLLALIVLGIAAPRWGFNSRDTFNSAEWERRNEVSYPQITPKKSK